jgi:LEA14-like dessication related protein
MKKILIPITIAAALALSACSSLPDGSKKPQLAITSVEAAQNNGRTGFNVTCSIRHSSLEPLKVRRIATTVSVNGTPMASGEDEEKREIAPNSDVVLTEFVPANLARPVSLETLDDPMVNARTEAKVKVYFINDEDSAFNPSASYTGKLEYAKP